MTHHDTALLVIDVQQGLFKKSTPIYRADELLNNINLLVDGAHRAGAPVIYVQHSNPKTLAYGTNDWLLHPRLQLTEGDCIIEKQHGNAFEGTALDELLKSQHIDTLVIMGLVTHGCVRATCMGAKELGYTVVLVDDGHSSYSKDAARLVEEWNQKLAAGTVELKFAAEIEFDRRN
jgi:nicotinamidase-related amidase